MSTFDGIVAEFPHIRIDNFLLHGQPPLACFLSHVHSDHLRGLESFKSPFIYCSAVTRELLLRLEKYPHRMNFAKNILETRKQTYRHLKTLLRPIPLHTPTEIELFPGNSIRVTLFDANHCPGAVMFLLEGNGKAIIYTGDVRSEQWWIDSISRNPCMIPYSFGKKQLDKLYLDTTFASSKAPLKEFKPKAEGIAELVAKVSEYPDDTVFYFNAWTFGYEEVWVALSAFLNSRVHLDRYRYRLFLSLGQSSDVCITERAPLTGFRLGNKDHPGCVTNVDSGVRIHSCERGTQCAVFANDKAIRITPIVTRHLGVEYAEMGAGGGHGDLDQVHELELNDLSAIGSLMELCNTRLSDQPELQQKIFTWLGKSVKAGGRNVKIDTTAFFDALHDGDNEGADELDDVPLDRLVTALGKLVSEDPKENKIQATSITFPYSRHSSYDELRALVAVFRPKALYPCTIESGLDMEALFGDLLDNENDQDAAPLIDSLPQPRQETGSGHTTPQATPSSSPESSPKRGQATKSKKRKLKSSFDAAAEQADVYNIRGLDTHTKVRNADAALPDKVIETMDPVTESNPNELLASCKPRTLDSPQARSKVNEPELDYFEQVYKDSKDAATLRLQQPHRLQSHQRAFQQQRAAQRERDVRWLEDKSARIEDLKRFSQTFKLSSPLPADFANKNAMHKSSGEAQRPEGPGKQESSTERLQRRMQAEEAAAGVNGRSWGQDVALSSVSGYHNQGKEVEL